jgi:hypothetical protein
VTISANPLKRITGRGESRMQRRVITLIFAFLLLVMQQAERSHALVHVGEWLHASHDRALAVPESESLCSLCVLFAGGSAAAIDSATPTPPPFAGFAIPIFTGASRPVPAPSYYASRAPPVLL